MSITVVGIDIGKNCFHLHALHDDGEKVTRKKLSRSKLYSFMAQLDNTNVVMETCGGAHFLARKFREYGHAVRLISPQFVKPFLKSHKTDYNDTEAITEAASRPGMRFVTIKTSEQQSLQLLHRFRQRMVAQRTALVNETRGALLEFGITIPCGISHLRAQLPRVIEDADNGLPVDTRDLLSGLLKDLEQLDERIKECDDQIARAADKEATCQRLMTIVGVGPITATALHAAIGDGKQFKNGRQLAAWLGLTPRQYTTGGKPRLPGISKKGDRYLRTLLIHCARAVLCRVKREDDRCKRWVKQLESRSHKNVATVGLANKLSRIAWAIITKGQVYQA